MAPRSFADIFTGNPERDHSIALKVLTLNQAVQLMNKRGSVAAAQKGGRPSARVANPPLLIGQVRSASPSPIPLLPFRHNLIGNEDASLSPILFNKHGVPAKEGVDQDISLCYSYKPYSSPGTNVSEGTDEEWHE